LTSCAASSSFYAGSSWPTPLSRWADSLKREKTSAGKVYFIRFAPPLRKIFLNLRRRVYH